MSRITNKIALSISSYFYDPLNENQISVEVSAVRNEPYGESCYPDCDYRFIWSQDSDDNDEIVTTLDLVEVTKHDIHPEALPTGNIEAAVRAYAAACLETMNFALKTVEM